MVRVRGHSENMAASLAKAVSDFMRFMGCASPGEVLERVRSLDPDGVVALFRDYFIHSKDRIAPRRSGIGVMLCGSDYSRMV